MSRVYLAALALLCVAACNKAEPLPKYGQVPDFHFQDQREHTVSRSTFAGKVVVADFIFTSCPDVCPLLTEQMAAVRKQLPSTASLAFASFTVDPEHDTPSKLRAFARAHGADQPNWYFVTGALDELRRVVTGGFKQAMEEQPVAAGKPRNVLHGTHFVLVDGQATIRGFYRSDADGQRELLVAAQQLLNEASSR